jgi:hypothetical protein
LGIGQNTFYIIGKSKKENKINYLDSDDIFMFRTEACTNYVTVNIGDDVSSDIVGRRNGPYKVSIQTQRRGRPTLGKICNKKRKCHIVELPKSAKDAGCV